MSGKGLARGTRLLASMALASVSSAVSISSGSTGERESDMSWPEAIEKACEALACAASIWAFAWMVVRLSR